MAELDTCAAIILAAGASTRLGQPKQLVAVDGETLLRRTARLAIQAGCLPVVVVLGRDAATLAGEVEGLGASIVINDEWQTGMASSLKARPSGRARSQATSAERHDPGLRSAEARCIDPARSIDNPHSEAIPDYSITLPAARTEFQRSFLENFFLNCWSSPATRARGESCNSISKKSHP